MGGGGGGGGGRREGRGELHTAVLSALLHITWSSPRAPQRAAIAALSKHCHVTLSVTSLNVYST